MAEKLLIEIQARDQASAVLKGVGAAVKTELKGMAGEMTTTAGSFRGGFAQMSSYVQAHEQQIRSAGMAITAFGAVVTGVMVKCVAMYGEAEEAGAKLTAAIKGTAQAIDQGRLEKLAADLQKTTTFEDDATKAMMAMLVTFNLTQDQVEQLAPRILNISAIMGTDLQSAAIAVGKAISTNNYGALQRFGIVIDEDTQKSGNFVDILKAIDRNTGPAAEELAKTSKGALLQFKNAVGDAGEVVGKALVPAIQAGTAILKPMAEIFQVVADTPVAKALIIVTAAAGALAVPLGGLLIILPSLFAGWEALTGAQLRNAAAADAAAAANTRAGVAAAGAGAAATGAAGATTVAAGATGVGAGIARGGLLGVAARAGRGIGRFAIGRSAAGIAGPASLIALGVYEGVGSWARGKEKAEAAQEAEFGKPGAPAGWEAALARSRAEAGPAVAGAPIGAAAVPTVEEISAEMAIPAAAAPPAPARRVGPMTEVGAGAWFVPTAPAGGAGTGEVAVRSLRQIGPGRWELVIDLARDVPAGVLDDGVTDWMADTAVAGVS